MHINQSIIKERNEDDTWFPFHSTVVRGCQNLHLEIGKIINIQKRTVHALFPLQETAHWQTEVFRKKSTIFWPSRYLALFPHTMV